MDQVDFTTNAPRRKGSHLTLEERVIIQTRRREKKSLRAIAREIHCSPSTVANELKRGQVLLYNGKISYRAGVGQEQPSCLFHASVQSLRERDERES